MKRIETPKVDQDHNICPEVSKHFSDNPQCSGKGAGESVLVLVHNHKTLNLPHFISQNIHQLLNKLCISLVLNIDYQVMFISILSSTLNPGVSTTVIFGLLGSPKKWPVLNVVIFVFDLSP